MHVCLLDMLDMRQPTVDADSDDVKVQVEVMVEADQVLCISNSDT